MAGIWERLKRDGTDRLRVHLLDAAMVFRATGDFTDQQILDGLNSRLHSPLTQDEIGDLAAISDTLNSQANTTAKLVYLEKIKAATICAEAGVIDEATFRSLLGIS